MLHTANKMTVIEISEPGGPEVLTPVQTTIPVPKAGEILVRVKAAGVNRPDVIQRQGHYPMPDDVTPIPGLEVAGTVSSIGEGVTGVKIGDRVCALTNGGGYGEYCIVPESQTLPVPDSMSMIAAAALPETLFTVWANLFKIGGATQGQSVLIHGGTSGIGTTALMLCREIGIEAYATAGSDDKCDVIAELGATPVNYRTTDFSDFILKQTDGRGVDIILDILFLPKYEEFRNGWPAGNHWLPWRSFRRSSGSARTRVEASGCHGFNDASTNFGRKSRNCQ